MKINFSEYIGKGIDKALNFSATEKPKVLKISDRTHVSYLKAGISFGSDADDVITAIQIYGEDDKEFDKYSQTIPESLDFSLSRQEVHALLGEPNFSGGGSMSKIIKTNAFDCYDIGDLMIAAHYSDDESHIVRISIQARKETPKSVKKHKARKA